MKKPQNSPILDHAKGILRDEANALLSIADTLDTSFETAIRMILAMSDQGRIIVSGMGKAGFVAMKISATLASVGFPSFFLHPAEAIHGDLGRYTKHDLALILSKSGETPEVLRMLPFIKRVGCPVV